MTGSQDQGVAVAPPDDAQVERAARCRRDFERAIVDRKGVGVTWVSGKPFADHKHPTLIGQVMREPLLLQWSIFREGWAHGFAAGEPSCPVADEAAPEGKPALRLVQG